MLFTPRDNTDSTRAQRWREEKTAIARYAAALLMRERQSVSSLILLPRGKRFLLQIAVRTRRDLHHLTFARSLRAAKSNTRRMPLSEKGLKSFKKYHFTESSWGPRDIRRGNGFTMPEASDTMLKKPRCAVVSTTMPQRMRRSFCGCRA